MNKNLGYLLVLTVLFGSAVFVTAGKELKTQWLGIAFGFFLGWVVASIVAVLKKQPKKANE